MDYKFYRITDNKEDVLINLSNCLYVSYSIERFNATIIVYFKDNTKLPLSFDDVKIAKATFDVLAKQVCYNN